MDEDPPSRRFYITPIQWIVALMVMGLVVALGFVIVRVPPRADRIYDWRYTNSSTQIVWPAQPPIPAQSMLMVSSDTVTNVFGFYRGLLHLPPLGGAMFTYRSGGFFGSGRNLQELGVIPNASRTTNLQTEMYLQYHRGQKKIILVSRVTGGLATAVWLNILDGNGDGNLLTSPITYLNALAYPGSLQSSGGSLMHGTAYSYTAATNLFAVERFYQRNFGSNAPANSSQTIALKTAMDSAAELFVLPTPPGPKTNEVAFLLLTKRTMSLIHAAATGTNSTHINIAVMAR